VLPLRLILNITYAELVKGMDRKQRDEFDSKLYGFDVMSRDGMRELRGEI
jgi:hypothetical protein